MHTPLEAIQSRDTLKKEIASKHGISLVVVPVWWDGTLQSLVATIKQKRPDLLAGFGVGDSVPISEEIPKDYTFSSQEQPNYVEGIGEPTTACFFTMTNVNPTNWWMFEKYDGARGFWNPEKKAFYSRRGRPYAIPPEIISSMPDNVFLDGERWFGRDNFEESLRMSSAVDMNLTDWSKFKYMVFDLPNHPGTYAERYEALVNNLGNKQSKYVEVAPKEICNFYGIGKRTFTKLQLKLNDGA